MSPWRALYAAALAAMVVFLGWRIIELGPEQPVEPSDGPAAPRLSSNPLDGDAFSDLAVAMRSDADPAAVLEMHQIAARRDPRDLRIRAWLFDHYAFKGEYERALTHMDVMLRLDPELRTRLVPLLVGWSDDPAFASALAGKLAEEPVWLPAMLAGFRKDIARPGAGIVFSALRESGTLGDAQTGYWLDALMNAGHWALARQLWADGLPQSQGTTEVPLLFNGGFESRASNQGFDWRVGRRAGSYTEFEPADGADGQAAHLVFSGRPVDQADLEQALALPPGGYVLSMRQRAVALRSDQGLRWTITCHRQRRPLVEGERIKGSFGWTAAEIAFEVPEEGCPGQWLRLDNPAPSGSASSISGELWLDNMAITVSGPSPEPRSSP